jgi:hypothetical protein
VLDVACRGWLPLAAGRQLQSPSKLGPAPLRGYHHHWLREVDVTATCNLLAEDWATSSVRRGVRVLKQRAVAASPGGLAALEVCIWGGACTSGRCRCQQAAPRVCARSRLGGAHRASARGMRSVLPQCGLCHKWLTAGCRQAAPAAGNWMRSSSMRVQCLRALTDCRDSGSEVLRVRGLLSCWR